MNIKTAALMLAASAALGCWAAPLGSDASAQKKPKTQKEEPKDTTGGFIFTDVAVIPSTGVKNQNKSGTCWCFSTMSTLEDEILRNGGDSLHLSEMYAVRQCYIDKADRYIRMYGQTNFAAGGSAADVPHVWKRYGMIPDSIYSGLAYGEDLHVHGELDAVLKAYLDAIKANPNKKISTAWRKGYEGILDAYLGEVPQTFVVAGKEYTPRSYADALPISMDDYVSITSFTHHPFYESFAIEVPDNWVNEQSVNLPMEEMKAVLDYAVEHGYPVAWGADVSENGFKWDKGFAVMPKEKKAADLEGTELSRWVKLSNKERREAQEDVKYPVDEMVITQEVRQQMFDNQQTTDDHGMEIVGYATDQDGKRYYKVKNSWDTNQVYGGYFYASEPYILAKTMNIMVHRDAIPEAIAKKIKK